MPIALCLCWHLGQVSAECSCLPAGACAGYLPLPGVEHAHLLQALIFSDVEGIKKYSAAMNAGDMYPLFAGMLTQRPWDQVRFAAARWHDSPMLLPLLNVATLSGCCTSGLPVSAAPANNVGQSAGD